ncbi:TIGR00282 family metallophosphoesterase [Candidatus Berkelbacteria bacterium]|uniref:TIGR00282 family metallophosphoesterase n=1 Tax=Candidatus Berkelbacteria bacterium CG10_big_fil_rev_8_21_14_0_10_41_12 TaxID=1974513 RepID=A0A2M6WX59_9BACT|nr:TIGR00282 family metallophosphoesterase [Candidatus Berkelbacteria bacterium]PIT97385.1 MAG: TIGR00282 family metallophosphoesterase [Candidatus Berkelbacteria bacterium CG10_big_fil_rev_8_21_14_0_10_41_12]
MKILFFGDITGRIGREAVAEFIADKRDLIKPDFIIANAENASSGRGPTENAVEELLGCGIDLITLGDHCWDQKSLVEYLSRNSAKAIRPLNFPEPNIGKGWTKIKKGNLELTVISAIGRVFTTEGLDSPFVRVNDLIEGECLKQPILIDFHAEATSEKEAFGHYFAGRVSAILGTHTHVQTADEQVLEGGTAYIGDVGMCGPQDSVIGVKKELSIERFLTARPLKFEIAEGPKMINAVVVDLDLKGKAQKIERIFE